MKWHFHMGGGEEVHAEEISVTFNLFSDKVWFYPSGYLHSQTNEYRSAENPMLPSECHYMFNFTCNVLSVQQGSQEPFFLYHKFAPPYKTHADTTFNICQVTGNMCLIQEECAPPHTTNHFQHHLYQMCSVKNLI